MSNQQFPPGWDEKRVQRLVSHNEQMDDDKMTAEDDSASEAAGQTLMVIPTDLVSSVRELIFRAGA